MSPLVHQVKILEFQSSEHLALKGHTSGLRKLLSINGASIHWTSMLVLLKIVAIMFKLIMVFSVEIAECWGRTLPSPSAHEVP